MRKLNIFVLFRVDKIAIREAGGAFGRLEAAREEEYFLRLVCTNLFHFFFFLLPPRLVFSSKLIIVIYFTCSIQTATNPIGKHREGRKR